MATFSLSGVRGMLTGGCFENEPDAGDQETHSLPSTHLDPPATGCGPCHGQKLQSRDDS